MREVRFIFPADCWQLARAAGLTIEETLDNWTDNSFLILEKMVYQFSGPNGERIQEINFSGLFRPVNPGGGTTGPHLQGRRIDVRSILFDDGTSITFNYSSSITEPPMASELRNWIFPRIPVQQYLTPWSMCGEGTTSRCVPNDGSTRLRRDHRDHMHITVVR